MPSNDERREVAARLREVRPKACVRGVLGWELACGDFECCEDCGRYALADLADLIEPEERTCHVEGSCYDELLEEDYTDLSCGHHLRGSAWEFDFCPTCGAKVVEE